MSSDEDRPSALDQLGFPPWWKYYDLLVTVNSSDEIMNVFLPFPEESAALHGVRNGTWRWESVPAGPPRAHAQGNESSSTKIRVGETIFQGFAGETHQLYGVEEPPGQFEERVRGTGLELQDMLRKARRKAQDNGKDLRVRII